MTDRALTEQELAFCRGYALRPDDPIGVFLATFAPDGGLCLAEAGRACGILWAREEIQREVYAQERILDLGDQGRILIELEEARQKALAEDFGAETALNATLAKAQMLGMFPAPPEPPIIELWDELPGERQAQPDPGTRH